MLTTIPLLTFLMLGTLYPLCFWIIHRRSIELGFQQFNLGMANVFGGLGAGILYFMNVPVSVKNLLFVWMGFFLVVSAICWKKKILNTWTITIPCFFGIFAFSQVFGIFVPDYKMLIPIIILGGLVLSLSLFTMILGHWYLNVHGLPIKYLVDATKVFWAVLILRFLWNAYILLTEKILYGGDLIALYRFMFHLEGFLLFVAVFFGTLLPMGLMYLVLETLKVKSTQSATGLLYIIVVAVLMGDLSYKYYLLRYGLAL